MFYMIKNACTLSLFFFLLVTVSCSIKKDEEEKVSRLSVERKIPSVVVSNETSPKRPPSSGDSQSDDISKVPSDRPTPTVKPIPNLKPAPNPPIEEPVKLPPVKIPTLAEKDSDFDFLNDQFEIDHGLNPFVADVPQINISAVNRFQVKIKTEQKNITIERSYSHLEPLKLFSPYDFLRLKLIKLQFLSIINPASVPSAKDFIGSTYYDLYLTSLIGDDKYFEYFQYLNNGVSGLGTLSIFFNLSMSSIEGVSRIQNIKLQTGFSDKEDFVYYNTFPLLRDDFQAEIFEFNDLSIFNSALSYNIYDQLISSSNIGLHLLHREELALKVTDFEFTRSGHKLRHQEFVSSLQENNATFIISTPSKTKVFYVSPEQTIEKFLDTHDFSYVKNKDGGIESMEALKWGSWSNSLPINSDLLNLSIEDKEKGVWKHLGSLNDIARPFEAGKMYVLSFVKGEEFLNSFIRDEVLIFEEDFTNEIVVSGIKANDQITLTIEGKVISPQVSAVKKVDVNALLTIHPPFKKTYTQHQKCHVHRIDRLVDLVAPLSFGREASFQIIGDESSLLLGDLSVDFVPVSNNQKFKVTFKLPANFKLKSNTVIIKDVSEKKSIPISYGHVNFGNCPSFISAYLFAEYSIPNYKASISKMNVIQKKEFKISIIRSGITSDL